MVKKKLDWMKKHAKAYRSINLNWLFDSEARYCEND